jgi:Na+-transporting methylmalonyl-CoA/oxaloacetate decarboxylase gamma subunit
MKLTRIVFIALAVLLPASWTVAKAADEAAPAEGKTDAKKEKKAKKGKKADKEAAPAAEGATK